MELILEFCSISCTVKVVQYIVNAGRKPWVKRVKGVPSGDPLTSGKLWLNMQYICRPPPDRDLGGGYSDFSEYFLKFFSYALQILHESNTSMKTCLSEKINVISCFKKFLNFRKKRFETKSQFFKSA